MSAKLSDEQLTPAQIMAAAEAWYTRQLETLERCHGKQWPAHREWVESYLKEELRQRLIAIGWRPKA